MSHSIQREIHGRRPDLRGVISLLFEPRLRFAEVRRTVSRAFGACRSLLADRRGMSAMELALVSLILVPSVIAVVELGNAAQQQVSQGSSVKACMGTFAASAPVSLNAPYTNQWNAALDGVLFYMDKNAPNTTQV